MKIASGTPQTKGSSTAERPATSKALGGKREAPRKPQRDTFASSDITSTTRATSNAKLSGTAPPPKQVNVNLTVSALNRGKVVGVDAGSISNSVCKVRVDVTRNQGEVLGVHVKGDVTRSTLDIQVKLGKDEGRSASAHIEGNVVDSVIVADGKVTVDGDVRGSIIVVNDPSDLIVKGKLSPDTKVMTPAEYEKYKDEHPLPAAGTR